MQAFSTDYVPCDDPGVRVHSSHGSEALSPDSDSGPVSVEAAVRSRNNEAMSERGPVWRERFAAMKQSMAEEIFHSEVAVSE